MNKIYKTEVKTKEGDLWGFEYEETDSFSELKFENCGQCYAVAFVNETEFIIVKNGQKNTWGLVGGSTEKGETLEETLRREIKEESNMEVIWFAPLGFQKCYINRILQPKVQARFVCHVRPFGPFVSDPDEKITEIKLVTKDNYKDYFNWDETGDVIIEKAQKLIQVKIDQN